MSSCDWILWSYERFWLFNPFFFCLLLKLFTCNNTRRLFYLKLYLIRDVRERCPSLQPGLWLIFLLMSVFRRQSWEKLPCSLVGGFLASEWMRRGSEWANRSFGAVVALEECKGLGNAGFDFRSPWLDCRAQRDGRAQEWQHPSVPLSCTKGGEKHQWNRLSWCDRRWECPGSAAAAAERP